MRLFIKFLTAGPGGLWAAALCTVCLAGCCGGMMPSARLSSPAVHPAHACAACAGPTHGLDAGCVVPSAGNCGADKCSSLIAWPRNLLRRCCGPLLHPGQEGGLTESELNPPHSRFHPVPSAPVFAQRYDYEPPERMLEPTPAHPRTAPQSLPHVPDVQPLEGRGAGERG